jgi:hypothetical protein
MGKHRISNRFAWFFLVVVSFEPACASSTGNLVRDRRLTICTESPKYTTLWVSGVYQNGEEIEISGRVWRHPLSPSVSYTGHVDVDIVGSDGRFVAKNDVRCNPRNIKKGSGKSSRFSARVMGRVDQGGVIRLTFHRGEHGSDTDLQSPVDSPCRGKEVINA